MKNDIEFLYKIVELLIICNIIFMIIFLIDRIFVITT